MQSIANIDNIANKVSNNKKIITKINNYKRLFVEPSLNINDRKIVENEIEILQSSLINNENIGGDELSLILQKYNLNSKLLENLEIIYLLKNCIIKGEITMIIAPPGMGKSSFALASAIHCLESNSIENVIYLDLDNSLVTLADRKINNIQDKYKNKFKYLHGSSISKYEMKHITSMMSQSELNKNSFHLFKPLDSVVFPEILLKI